MSIFDRASVFGGEQRYRDQFVLRGVVGTVESKLHEEIRSEAWPIKHRFDFRLTITQSCWATPAEVQHGNIIKTCQRSIAAELYRDILPELAALRVAIESGDRQAALEATFRIEEATQWK